ncbi:HalOD1 output domain-containing protein (plasmid) [Haloferacaceae archaeon DSL9]
MNEQSIPGPTGETIRRTDRTHQFTSERADDCRVTVSVIKAVAAVTGVDSLSLQPRLYHVLDPDALEALVGSDSTGSGPTEVTFEFAGCRVTVGREQRILIEELPTDRSAEHRL